jgi:uroporphyrinogen-III synthase
MKQSFTGLKIAIPESRQLDVLANLFVKRGADVIRCPLVAIHDSPKKDVVEQWLKDFIGCPPELLILLTGEGIRRLTGFAERAGLYDEWKHALSQVYKLARGPKPNRALKLLDLQADALAPQPTTDGVIEYLSMQEISQKSIAVQLYGEDPNEKLQDYLRERKANYNTIAPYIYASDVEEEKVLELIHLLSENKVDLICFTSKAQLLRLQKVATKAQLYDLLDKGLKQVQIAAVGPVVADLLEEAGYTVAVMPEEKYFMKPMITAIEDVLLAR